MIVATDINGNDPSFPTDSLLLNGPKFADLKNNTLTSSLKDIPICAWSESAGFNEIESDDDLKTVGSISPVRLEELHHFVAEDWELEILRDSPYYCEGDELDESLTGPYKIIAEEQKETFVIGTTEYVCQPALTHIPSEPTVKRWDRKLICSGNNVSADDPNQFDDACS